MDRRGSFAVALRTIRWRSANQQTQQQPTEQPTRAVWASVTLEAAATLDGVWFTAEDDNASTKSVELTRDADEWLLEYTQSSRPIALSNASLAPLVHARLCVAVYCGSTRSRTSDQLWGEASVAFLPALMSARLEETVRFVGRDGGNSAEEIAVALSVQCDADLADFALGARVLRVHSLAIVRPPSEWTLPSATDEEAMRLCSAPDRNAAVYELELPLPDFGGESCREIIRFSGGKLQYTPNPNPTRQAEVVGAGTAGGLTGEWSIAFPSSVVHKLYPKASPAIVQLTDFLQVEKTATATLRRTNVDAVSRVTASVSLNLHGLTAPGQTQVAVDAPLKKILPLPKEALEQELAAAVPNDDKKRLQALLTDYDATCVQTATALSVSMRVVKTRVVCGVEIVGNGPLVPDPPATLTPTKTIDELIPPRDLSDEYDQRKDVVADLRTEIRRVVLTVLREYEDADLTLASRDEKRQRIVFQLNSQGAYHTFKEKLKKRIVPMVRDQCADDAMTDAPSATDEDDELGFASRTNARKKAYFASVYATLMDEVQRVLHEVFFASSSSSSSSSETQHTLEKTHGELQPRDEAIVTRTLTALGLRALENEVNGDADKSEALHLDRIAFAEARVAEMPHAAVAMQPSLATVWLEYANFCLGQSELDKAGGALRQSLSLEPHRVDALITYGALLCELKDFTAADVVVKNAVGDALDQAAHSSDAAALAQLVTAHALLALYFSESKADATGNLVLFELLKAQRVLRRLQQTTDAVSSGTEPCVSSVWIHLAAALHALRLRGGTLVALQLGDQCLCPRDVLSRNERVVKRVVLADVLSLRGDGDRATALLEDALEIDRDHALAWFVLGRTALQLESQTPRAVECLQRSLERRHQLRADQRLSLVVHLGLVLLQTSQFALARATFLGACDEFPLASTWLGVGIASLRLEQWDAAQIALAEANRLDASNPEVWGYVALLALSATPRVTRQHERRATQSVAQAMRCQLSNPVLLRELSSGFVAIDRLALAERLLRRALVFQDASLTRKTLADVLAAQNCAEAALAQYQQSLDESRDLAQRTELLDKCAALLGTLGRPDEAAACRRMAAQLLLQAPEGRVTESDSASAT